MGRGDQAMEVYVERNYRNLARLTQPRKELILEFKRSIELINNPIYGKPGQLKWTEELYKFMHQRSNGSISFQDVVRWLNTPWGKYTLQTQEDPMENPTQAQSKNYYSLQRRPKPKPKSRKPIPKLKPKPKLNSVAIEEVSASTSTSTTKPKQTIRSLPTNPTINSMIAIDRKMPSIPPLNQSTRSRSRSRSSTPSSLSLSSFLSTSLEALFNDNDNENENATNAVVNGIQNFPPVSSTSAINSVFQTRQFQYENQDQHQNQNVHFNHQNLVLTDSYNKQSGFHREFQTQNQSQSQNQSQNLQAQENSSSASSSSAVDIDLDIRSIYQGVFEAIEIIHDACTKIPAVKSCLIPLEEISKAFHRNHHKLIFPKRYSQVAAAAAAAAATETTEVPMPIQTTITRRGHRVKVEPGSTSMSTSTTMNTHPTQSSFLNQPQHQQIDNTFRSFENLQQSNFHLVSGQISTMHASSASARNARGVGVGVGIGGGVMDDEVRVLGSILRATSGFWTTPVVNSNIIQNNNNNNNNLGINNY